MTPSELALPKHSTVSKAINQGETILSTEQSTALNMMLAHYGDDPRVQCLRELKVAAEPLPMTDAHIDWRIPAAKWLHAKSDFWFEKEKSTPNHWAAYPSWHAVAINIRWLADELDQQSQAEPVQQTPFNKATALALLTAASKSGDAGAISLAAQLSNAAPCKDCGFVNFKCRCEMQAEPLPMTDDEIYALYSEPRSDAEMVEFARAIEAHHGIKPKGRGVAAEPEAQWLPIESAPKDGTGMLLYFSGIGWVRGSWDSQRHHEKPKPYWTHDSIRYMGVAHARANQPKWWMPLPAAPEAP